MTWMWIRGETRESTDRNIGTANDCADSHFDYYVISFFVNDCDIAEIDGRNSITNVFVYSG